MKPAGPIDPEHWTKTRLMSSGEFTDFCTIAPNIGGLEGVGASGKFHCTFINGKFCFHVAASLCWGYGAKGGLIFEVGTNSIAEFGAWLVYQLHRLDYGFFSIVDKDVFAIYSRACVVGLIGVGLELYARYAQFGKDLSKVAGDLSHALIEFAGSAKDQIAASRRRNMLAKNTISRRFELLTYTPESKGILIYLLTRHGELDYQDPNNMGENLVPDFFQQRKKRWFGFEKYSSPCQVAKGAVPRNS